MKKDYTYDNIANDEDEEKVIYDHSKRSKKKKEKDVFSFMYLAQLNGNVWTMLVSGMISTKHSHTIMYGHL